MKKSSLIIICIAILMAMTALAFSASALCSTCTQEGDWSQSANSFIEGKPISDVPQAFGPRVVRETTSQFENTSKATPGANSNDTNAAVTPAAATSVPEVAINLMSINASPDSVKSGSPVRINAAFSVSSQMQSENQTGIANSASTSPDGETLLTASAAIKDGSGKNVGTVNLAKSNGNEYSGSWNAQVPAGVYNATIFASSLQGSGTFNNALQINVVASGDAPTNTPAVKKLG
jgi:flagellar basal body-associated protein FliL